LNENQSGFRKRYSTIDNIFVLYAFFELLKLKRKKLFVTFVDFEKAFDKVWRDGRITLPETTLVFIQNRKFFRKNI
jgi:hypothetical protein